MALSLALRLVLFQLCLWHVQGVYHISQAQSVLGVDAHSSAGGSGGITLRGRLTPSPALKGRLTQGPTLGTRKTDMRTLEGSETSRERRSSNQALRFRGGGFFPVQQSETGKFFGLSFMMFCIIFIFTTLRDTKDTLIVTTCGAEAIAFLKVYGVIPAATVFMVYYSKISNLLTKRQLFYVTFVPFLVFYSVFAFLIYPLRDQFHPVSVDLGPSLKVVASIFQHWTFAVYYIVSELYGSVGVPLLFWQLANDVVGIEQAKRFYPLFGTIGNLAPVFSGQSTAFFTQSGDFVYSLKCLTVVLVLVGFCVMGLHEYVSHLYHQETLDSSLPLVPSAGTQKKPKPQLGILQSFGVLLRSKYLGCMCVLVLAYSLTIAFSDIIWKASVKELLPDNSAYLRFMGWYSSASGIVTTLTTLAGSRLVNRLGWRVGALATPVTMAVVALPFFTYLTFGGVGKSTEALTVAVGIGTVQNILSKATKYAVFDPTKEMAYIPLDKDSKVKGKAAIDVLGARLGKMMGALLQQLVILRAGSSIAGAPAIGVMFYIVIAAWISSTNRLAIMFDEKVANQKREDNA